MFRTIVLALLFIELGIPLIAGLIGLAFEDGTIGCIIFGLVITVLIIILA